MDMKVMQQLEPLIVGLAEYELVYHPKAELDPRRELCEINFEGITDFLSKKERLIAVRGGKAIEIAIARRQESKFDYGDFRHEIEPGEPIQNHLIGDEEAVLIVRSEFSTKPKGPHLSTKVIEIYE